MVLGKSNNLDRLKENTNIFDFVLEDSDMEQINKLNKNLRYFDEKSCRYPIKYPIFK